MTARLWSAPKRVMAAWTAVVACRLDTDDVRAQVAVALGRLDRHDAGQPGKRDRGRVVRAADDDAQAVLVEAGQQVGGRRRADEPAAIEDRDVVADPLDVVEDVGRVEDGCLALEIAHQVEHLATPDRVKRADRLVQQEHGRAADQCLGDAEPLAHPAGVSLRASIGRFGQPDPARGPRRRAFRPPVARADTGMRRSGASRARSSSRRSAGSWAR